MAATEEDLFRTFDDLGIVYTLYRHPPIFTVEESQAMRINWPDAHCKCLFLRDKKKNMVLAAVHEDLRVDLKKLARTLGLGRFSFCNPDLMMRVLGITPGAVNPFSVMNVKNLVDGETFQVVLDKKFAEFDAVHFHPLHNEATVGVSFADLIGFIEHFGFQPRIIDFS